MHINDFEFCTYRVVSDVASSDSTSELLPIINNLATLLPKELNRKTTLLAMGVDEDSESLLPDLSVFLDDALQRLTPKEVVLAIRLLRAVVTSSQQRRWKKNKLATTSFFAPISSQSSESSQDLASTTLGSTIDLSSPTHESPTDMATTPTKSNAKSESVLVESLDQRTRDDLVEGPAEFHAAPTPAEVPEPRKRKRHGMGTVFHSLSLPERASSPGSILEELPDLPFADF
ncbi:hypothetical protein DFS34DRAFT_648509 [Phlyctochytrium arcticum]|nr:hypothetical protein DFS34DRAFT_648509 [Phlyctochytrium arcticum]